ncbi:flavoprotein [Amycolatopsis sp. cmx-4-54]|uniref:flavoprotein n=1 Tax=Amycolatopsis sp. cmx-4-54 TaxID=2790936 RepID=UPI00397CDEFC
MTERTLYLIGSAAPPVRDLGTLISQFQDIGWRACVFATPTAATWVDIEDLEERTGFPIGLDGQQQASLTLPEPELILACPATFNTINKWVSGISDNYALGILNEAFGFKTPTYLMPYAKSTLAAHPAFISSLSKLSNWGVHVLPNELVRPTKKNESFLWNRLINALPLER